MLRGLFATVQTLCKSSDAIEKDSILFAVSQGVFRGEFIVYMEDDENKWVFFSLPDFYIRKITEEDFKKGISLGIVEKVEKLPTDVLELIKAQYRKTKNLVVEETDNSEDDE